MGAMRPWERSSMSRGSTRSRSVKGEIVFTLILVPPSKPARVEMRHYTTARSGIDTSTPGGR